MEEGAVPRGWRRGEEGRTGPGGWLLSRALLAVLGRRPNTPLDGEENPAVGSADVSLACDPETFNCFVGFISVRSLRDEQLVSALGRREGCGRRRVCGGEDEASAYLFAQLDI